MSRFRISKNKSNKSIEQKNKIYHFEWLDKVSLTQQSKEPLFVNFISLKIEDKLTKKITYSSAWITDLEVKEELVKTLIESARARWKIESAPQVHKVETKEESNEIKLCAKAA